MSHEREVEEDPATVHLDAREMLIPAILKLFLDKVSWICLSAFRAFGSQSTQ